MPNLKDKVEENKKDNEENNPSKFSSKIKKNLFETLMNKRIILNKFERYFRDNLELEEFKNLKTLVIHSKGTISWEELAEEGVIKIEGNKVEGIYWKGNLNLKGTKLKSLWKIKKVDGNLLCPWVGTLKDLGILEKVGGFLEIYGTSIKNLRKLKYVGLYLDCEGLETLEDLGDLEYIGGVNINGISIIGYSDFIKRLRRKELVISGNIEFPVDIFQLYKDGKLDFNIFREMFGEDIMKLENEEMREISSLFLTMEYEELKGEFKEKGNKIRKENEGKELIEEDQIQLRELIKGLGKELKKIRERIESFGLKLDDL